MAGTSDHPPALPLLPKNFEAATRGLTQEQRDQMVGKRRSDFVKAKAQFMNWVRQDRDPLMNKTAKLIGAYLIECVNFDTGRCFPSHETIADHIGSSVRTVERTIPRLIEAGWISIRRVRRNAPTFYRFNAPPAKVKRIEECTIALKANRDARREERRYPRLIEHEITPEQVAEFLKPTPMSGRPQFEPTLLTGPDPTLSTGEHLKGTPEDCFGYEREEHTPRTRERDVLSDNAYARAKEGW